MLAEIRLFMFADISIRRLMISDPNMGMPQFPPMGPGLYDPDGQVRVVTPKPKPQCWEHGCKTCPRPPISRTKLSHRYGELEFCRKLPVGCPIWRDGLRSL